MKRERGSALLLELIVALAILSIILAAIIPAGIRLKQIESSNNAAKWLAEENAGEFSFAQSYQIYPAPSGLTGTLANPLSCSNPMLLSGQQVQSPPGYAATWTPKAAKASGSCASVQGYAGYTVALDPISRLDGSRHFFSDSDDPAGPQLIHFAEGRPATITDPIFPAIASSLTVIASGGGGGTPSCPAGSGETWNGSVCACPSGQSLNSSGVCVAQVTCQTNETQINGQCYTTFPSSQGYPVNYFYQTSATFNNAANFAAPITGTGVLTFQFTDAQDITFSGQLSSWSTNTAAWSSLPTFGTCLASGVVNLTNGGTITLSPPTSGSCYVQGTWPIPAGGMIFSANGLSFSFPNGQLNSSTGFEGQSTGLSMLISGSLNPMPN